MPRRYTQDSGPWNNYGRPLNEGYGPFIHGRRVGAGFGAAKAPFSPAMSYNPPPAADPVNAPAPKRDRYKPKAKAKKARAKRLASMFGNRLYRMAGIVRAGATKGYDATALKAWTDWAPTEGSLDERIGALEYLVEAGVPEEVEPQVHDAIYQLQEEIADLEETIDASPDEEWEDDEDEMVYEPEYYPAYDDEVEAVYAEGGYDDGGEYKAIPPGYGYDDEAELEAAAAALTDRVYQNLAAMPAIKSAGFAVPEWEGPYFHTHSPRDTHAAHIKAFYEYIRKGELHMQPALLNHLQACTKAVMVEDSDGEGGYLLPDEFSNDLIRALYNDSYLRKAGARLLRMHHKTLEMPSVTASTAAVRTSEGAPYNEEEPTTGVVTFYATKLTRIAKATEELMADSRFDIWNDLLKLDFTQAFAEGENRDFTNGAGGTTAPQGIAAAVTTGVTAASATEITADEIKRLRTSVDYKYRNLPSAAFMANDSTFEYIRRLKDGEGRYLISGDLAKGQEETLLGHKCVVNNSMAEIATGNDTLIFGAFQYFAIADRSEMTIVRLNEKYRDEGKIGFIASKRNDSRLLLAAAFRCLTQA